MSNYTDLQFRCFFQNSFDEQIWIDMLQNLFQVQHLRTKKEEILQAENAYFYGSTTTADHYSIGFFRYDIDAENIARRRVALRQLVKTFINKTLGTVRRCYRRLHGTEKNDSRVADVARPR